MYWEQRSPHTSNSINVPCLFRVFSQMVDAFILKWLDSLFYPVTCWNRDKMKKNAWRQQCSFLSKDSTCQTQGQRRSFTSAQPHWTSSCAPAESRLKHTANGWTQTPSCQGKQFRQRRPASCDATYVSDPGIQMNVRTKQKQTHRFQKLICGYQRGTLKGGESIRSLGLTYAHHYV